MKKTLLLWLAFLVKIASLITGLAAIPQLHLLPAEWMAYATIAFAAASILKDTANRIGDLLDDGKLNGSFKTLVVFLLPLLLFTSCVNGDFLGVSKEGWIIIGKDVGTAAAKSAAATVLPAYARERAQTSGKESTSVLP